MATKKKSNKQAKKKSVAGKPAPKKKASKTKAVAKKAAAKKSPAPKKTNPKSATRKIAPQKSASRPRKWFRGKREELDTLELPPVAANARSAGQSGSLQGLSDVETADSESVDELIEEGNSFEAEVVKGVEDAPDPDEDEVHTHERPEDDVPDDGEM